MNKAKITLATALLAVFRIPQYHGKQLERKRIPNMQAVMAAELKRKRKAERNLKLAAKGAFK